MKLSSFLLICLFALTCFLGIAQEGTFDPLHPTETSLWTDGIVWLTAAVSGLLSIFSGFFPGLDKVRSSLRYIVVGIAVILSFVYGFGFPGVKVIIAALGTFAALKLVPIVQKGPQYTQAELDAATAAKRQKADAASQSPV